MPGSDSSALQIAYLGSASCFATSSHFVPVGEAGAAHAAELGLLQLGDQLGRVELAREHRAQDAVVARVRLVGSFGLL